MAQATGEGVQFRPDGPGRASTIIAARDVFASAVETVDSALAGAIRSESDWRAAYTRYGVPMMLAGLRSREAALTIARKGVQAAHNKVQFVRDGRAMPVSEVAALGGAFETKTICGEGKRISSLRVPFGGRILEGAELEQEILRWRDRHLAEPACVEALLALARDPAPLDLSGRTFVLLGAGAEVGPLRPLLEWGATILALDLDRPEVSERIAATAKATAGRVLLPRKPGRAPGADLLAELPEIIDWLDKQGKIDVIGAYAYLDGEKHVRVTIAMDRIISALAAVHPETMVAYLMTPTEVFAVPEKTAEVSRNSFDGRGLLSRPLRSLSRGRLFEANIQADAVLDGSPHAVVDCVEVRQGPNYLLAKRLQRWRVFLAQADGRRVSCNVAPMTRTRSVLSNRIYAAGYRGTKPLGIETFDADTTNTVMAALLVHDLRRPLTNGAHPETILRDRAFHGGLWTCPYQLRTIIEAGVAAGLLRAG